MIVVNREDDDLSVFSMSGGDTEDGPPCVETDPTIPVKILNNTDGEAIVAALQNGPVVMFIGNKTNAFDNDISIVSGSALISKSTDVLSQRTPSVVSFIAPR